MSNDLSSSAKKRDQEFFICIVACPIVRFMVVNSLSIVFACFSMADITTSVVSLPSAANALNCPMVTPIPVAMASDTLGICSITELSSCPLKALAANPCVSWTRAASAEVALAPDITKALDMAFVTVNSLLCSIFKLLVLRAILVYKAAVDS